MVEKLSEVAEKNGFERILTFGEDAVGLTFNPSNNPDVDKIKQLYAEIIDLLNYRRNQTGPGEKGRYLSVAITEAQTAQMWAVKGITKEVPVVNNVGVLGKSTEAVNR